MKWKQFRIDDPFYFKDGDENVNIELYLNEYWTTSLKNGNYELIHSHDKEMLELYIQGKGSRWDEVYSEYLGGPYEFSNFTLSEKVTILHVMMMEDGSPTCEIYILDSEKEIKNDDRS